MIYPGSTPTGDGAAGSAMKIERSCTELTLPDSEMASPDLKKHVAR